MHVLIRNYKDLDGWDVLLFIGGMVIGASLLAAMHFNLTPSQIGTRSALLGIVPFGIRRTFFPHTVKNASRHTVVTLALMGVGGFVTLVGLLIGALVTMFLSDTRGADAPSSAIVLIPIGVLFVGGLLLVIGARLARSPRPEAAVGSQVPSGG
jgi:hypothetical protein